MLKYHDAKVGRPNVAELKELLGPMLVLSSESAERFEGVFDKLLACLNVQDIVEGLLIRDYAEADWEARRYNRLRTLSFERSFKQSLDFQVQRLKAQRARKQEQVRDLAEYAALKPADIAEAMRLEQQVFELEHRGPRDPQVYAERAGSCPCFGKGRFFSQGCGVRDRQHQQAA